MWSRAAWVGLSSKSLGRLRLGNGTSLLFINSITSNAFVDSTVFSPINLVTFIGSPLSGGTGWTNQIMIDSANLRRFQRQRIRVGQLKARAAETRRRA